MFYSTRIAEDILNDFLFSSRSQNFDYRISKSEHGHEISVDLPGVKKEDVEITPEADGIELKWKRNGKAYSYFVPLLNPSERSTAKLENGVLTISVPEEKASKKKIEVK